MRRDKKDSMRNPSGMALLLTVLVSAIACGGSSGSVTGTGGRTTSSSGGNAAGGGNSTGGASAAGGVTGSGGLIASGGNTGSGGSSQTSGAGGGASCSSVAPCGGDLTGNWNATSSCLKVSGALDPSLNGLSCSSAPITGGNIQVTGTLNAKPDGTYSDSTLTSGTEQFTLAKSCLVLSSTPISCAQAAVVMQSQGFSAVSCDGTADGGCSCLGTVQQTGGIGLVSTDLSATGTYKTSNNVVTLTGDTSSSDLQYSYCVSGSTMNWIPQTTGVTLTGATAFLKQGGGAGGASGSGGATGAGATTGRGGASAAGGRTGGGGTTSAGGASAAGGGTGSGGSSGSGGSTGGSTGPCDLLAAANTPCVAAHSTVRTMFAGYSKPLYQVKKVSDGSTKDISVLAGTSIADASAQDAFCGTTSKACTISIIYDQAGNGNDLKVAKMCPSCSGCPGDSSKKGQPDVEAFADLGKITIAGHPAYGVHILPCGGGIPNQTGYRCDTTKNTPTGDQPESVYMVVDGVTASSGCCFDYGNASTNDMAGGLGTMDAVEFSSQAIWGTGAGSGPWVGADLESGVYTWNGAGGNWKNPNSVSLKYPFVTALMKNNSKGAAGGPFVLKGGDATTTTLTTMWNGARPSGYETMQKVGGIVLGIGGDGAAGGKSNFYEGAMLTGFSSDTTDTALQANIVAAGYGK